jgi:hypothetical protein
MSLRFGSNCLQLGDVFEPSLVLVPWHEASDIVREGGYQIGIRGYHEKIALSAVFDRMRSGDASVRSFVMAADAGYAFDLHRHSDHDVLDIVRDLLRGRFVVLVRDTHATATAAGQGQMDKEWAAYDAFSAHFGKEFTSSSRRMRLTSRDQVAVILQTADYDVVPRSEAIGIVTALAAQARRPNLISAAQLITEKLLDLRDPPQ